MGRDETFDPFLDDVKGLKSSKKSKREAKKDKRLYGADSFDFGDNKDDDDTYGLKEFSNKGTDIKREKVTIQSLFEFRSWEVGVLVIEVLLVAYLVLVVMRIIPIF